MTKKTEKIIIAVIVIAGSIASLFMARFIPGNETVSDDTPSEMAVVDDKKETAETETSAKTSSYTGPTETVAGGVCGGSNNLDGVPDAYKRAVTKYTTLNEQYLVNVCTEDADSNGSIDYIVIESTDQPEHESSYYEDGHEHHESYDYETNVHKYSDAYDGQRAHSAGRNMIEAQSITMRIPVSPSEASTKTATSFGTIGIALNGVSFFNENAAPGDEITDELYTFDQCSGHPQQQGVYHYHVDAVCLVRDLGGDVIEAEETIGGVTHKWLEDGGTNAGLLLGFLLDGYPVYAPLSGIEKDCNQNDVSELIDDYNGHSHCTEDFPAGMYHYHVKTANSGSTNNPVFWITNSHFYGSTGSISN